ncbi:MAG TPA: S9 family peptidase [Thermoanaerobaculia bacterium]|nr:S9 family peptidase [Thermoanaerobaculia bacterium]
MKAPRRCATLLIPLLPLALLQAAHGGQPAAQPASGAARATAQPATGGVPAPAPAVAMAQPASPAAAAALGIDPELERTVARMARVGACYSASFSPDGLRVAFVSTLTGVPQVWTVAADGGWPEEVTALDDQVSAVEWSPDGRWLAFALAPGGGMNQQVYLVRPDGAELTRVTEGGKATNWLGGWSHDGRLLRIASNRAGPASMDPYTYELASGAFRRVAEGHGSGELADISRDGRWALVGRSPSRGDANLYLVELATGREALLTPHQPPGTFEGGELAPDGAAVYLAGNGDRDRIAFARVRLGSGGAGAGPAAAGPLEVLAARDDAELDELRITDDGRTAALLWNVAGRSELAFADLATLRQEPAPPLPGEIAGGLSFSHNGRFLAMTVSGSRLPSDVWVLDRVSGRLRQVTHSPHAGVDLGALVAPELLRFRAHDGLELSGWLYRPAGRSGPLPVVLSFHGGPEGQERPGFNATYQALLARGIGVFAPNVRGSAGFGKRFVNLDNGALRADAIRDIRAAAEALIAQGIAAPGHLGIMGGSYGGYMTMAGLTEYPELFAAGADLYGIVNFETFFAHTEPWMAAISKVEYGDPDTQKELLRSLSPIHKLDRIKAPTLVLHGANDTNVPVVEAEQVVAALKQRGVPVQYVFFADEGHGFRKTANRIRSSAAIVQWFERYLLAPAAAPPRPASRR